MKRITQHVFLFSLLALLACGGGGSDSDPDFAGVWSGSVSLVENTCPREIPVQYLSFLHQVKQNSDLSSFNAIVLDDGADLYGSGGGMVEETAFSVSGDAKLLPGFLEGNECFEQLIWRYESVNLDIGLAGFIVRESLISCSGVQCEVTYTGSAYRSTGQPLPYPCCYTVEGDGSDGGVTDPGTGAEDTNPLTGK